MKTKVLGKETKPKEHDWSKPCLYKHCDSELLVLGNGSHWGNLFAGTVLMRGLSWNIGEICNNWSKSNFTPIATPVTILFEPE